MIVGELVTEQIGIGTGEDSFRARLSTDYPTIGWGVNSANMGINTPSPNSVTINFRCPDQETYDSLVADNDYYVLWSEIL